MWQEAWRQILRKNGDNGKTHAVVVRERATSFEWKSHMLYNVGKKSEAVSNDFCMFLCHLIILTRSFKRENLML